jgi:hypothetical protein
VQISATIRAALSASDRRLARLAGLVAQQTLDRRFGEAVLPTPHHRPADADALSNPLNRPASAEASTMLARSTCPLPPVAFRHDRLQPLPVQSANDHTYCLSHTPNIAHSRALVNLSNASEL